MSAPHRASPKILEAARWSTKSILPQVAYVWTEIQSKAVLFPEQTSQMARI